MGQRESLEYHFKPEELRELGAELARANQAVYDLRAEKVATVTSVGALIKAAEKLAAELTMKLNQKFEFRDVEVVFDMDRPKPGLKTMIRTDTNVEVRIMPMSLEEQQGTFRFEEGKE